MKHGFLQIIEGGDPVLEQAAAWFARMHADDVGESDRERWRSWMDDHDNHRAAFESIERLWSEFGDFAATPEVAGQLAAVGREASVQRRHATRRSARRWFAGVAAAILAAIGGWSAISPPADQGVYYTSEAGERRSVTLDDGTRIELDADSRLHVRYSRNARDVLLERGRALFDVAHATDRPFTVNTVDGGARAIGTRFEVHLHNQATQVSLFEGKVAVLSAQGPDAPQSTLATLEPGQFARMGADFRTPELGHFDPGRDAPWLNGRLLFEDTPLPAALAEFNRYQVESRLVADPSLATLSVSGVFHSDDPAGFVEALEAAYGITAKRDANGSLVLSGHR